MCAGLYKGGGFLDGFSCCVDLVVKLYLETLQFRWWNLRSSDAGGDPQHISQLIQMMARLGFWAVVKKNTLVELPLYMGCITMLLAFVVTYMKAFKGSPVSHTKKRSRQWNSLVTQVMKQMNSLVRIPGMEVIGVPVQWVNEQLVGGWALARKHSICPKPWSFKGPSSSWCECNAVFQ